MSSVATTVANNTSAASAFSYAAAAAARPVSPVKYVPVHRRALSDTDSQRSASPTPSEASTSTLVDLTSPQPAQPQKSRVYSIATLLQLSHEPEIKVISLERREMLKQKLPEIVMNRKLRKATEFHVIQERAKLRSQDQRDAPSSKVQERASTPVLVVPSQQRQRPGQRKQPRAIGTERRRNASKVVDEASWRTVRLPVVAV